jgi:hypothetical protein
MIQEQSDPEWGMYDYIKIGAIYSTVSLECFFTGNEDKHSIGYFLKRHPGIPLFYELLKKIRSRDDVEDVWIEIDRVEIFEKGDKYMWPYSDTVLIITSASQEEVSRWVGPLMPSDIKECMGQGETLATSMKFPDGYKVFAVLWN